MKLLYRIKHWSERDNPGWGLFQCRLTPEESARSPRRNYVHRLRFNKGQGRGWRTVEEWMEMMRHRRLP